MIKQVRHIQVKAWPEIENFYPALIPFDRKGSGKNNPVDIDFTSVKKVQSSGLAILIIHVLKLINESGGRKWHFKDPENLAVANAITKLGFKKILYDRLSNQISLWDEGKETSLTECVKSDLEFVNTISYPIVELDFASTINKRKVVDRFREKLFEDFKFLRSDYKFKVHIFIQVLAEMAKNSADHSETNAFFGIDILIFNDEVVIKFVFGDLGIGINKNVRSLLQIEQPKRVKHLGLVETYHFAMTPGKTTKQNSKINRGIGMPIIFELSKELNINLSVFDAESRGIITGISDVSHNELRRNFFSLGRSVGFYYYGELNFKY